MRRIILRTIAVLTLAVMLPLQVQAQERRVALIIGNSDYDLVTPLDNPGNDATDLHVALEGLGFEVFLGLDITGQEMA